MFCARSILWRSSLAAEVEAGAGGAEVFHLAMGQK